jgi:Tfp pilus assembly PilM family ATPase
MALRSKIWSLEEQVVGLDIGEESIVAAQVAEDADGRVSLLNAGWVATYPEAGPAETAGFVRDLWKQRRFRTRTVCASLRSRSLLLKQFAYDGLTREELTSALRLEAEASLQMPQADLAVDWHLSREGQAEAAGGGPWEGVLVAAPRSDLDRLLSILRAAGLYAVVVDVVCLALANAAVALGQANGNSHPVGLVNLSRNGADLAIVYEGGRIYPRTMLSRSPTWEETAGYLLNSIEDNLKYFAFKLHQRPVDRILFSGQVPAQEIFVAAHEAAASAKGCFWNPLADLGCVEAGVRSLFDGDPQRASLLAPAIGLALRRE